jgi:hypothetical protein
MMTRASALKLRIELAVSALFVLCIAVTAAAQSLQIVSPADGTLVSPGQVVTISVVTSGGNFDMVTVFGRDPFLPTGVLTAPPYRFPFQVPRDISPGRYVFTASGTTGPGQLYFSDPIALEVELPNTPVKLTVSPSVLIDMSVGDRGYLSDVEAVFADGSTRFVDKSKRIFFHSDDTAVITIDNRGSFTAVAPGSTSISVSYGGLITQVPVSVRHPVEVFSGLSEVNASLSTNVYVHLFMPEEGKPGVTWSLHPQIGRLVSQDQYSAVYTAPPTVPAPTRVIVTATSLANPGKSGWAELLVLPAAIISISPPAITLGPGKSQEFSATISNSKDQWVDWSITPAGIGKISWRQVPGGMSRVNHLIYAAPAALNSPQAITVTATNGSLPGAKAVVTITLVP